MLITLDYYKYSSLDIYHIFENTPPSLNYLDKSTWNYINTNGFNRVKRTRRGCRSGNHVKQFRNKFTGISTSTTDSFPLSSSSNNFPSSSISSLTILHGPAFLLLNARSILNKLNTFRLYVSHYKPLFIAITESWTPETIPDSVLQVPGYNLFRKDRKNQKGGGILLYVTNCVKCICNEKLTYDVYDESLWCNLWINSDISLLVGVVYRPPQSNLSKNHQLFNLLNKLSCDKSSYKLIVGDFNFPSINWNTFQFSPCCDEFMDVVLDLNLSQHVLQPTRNDAILDLVFSSDPNIVSNVDILEPLCTSDHNMVLCELCLQVSSIKPSLRKSYCFQKADWCYFSELFALTDCDKIFANGSVDEVWHEFALSLSQIVDLAVPVKNQFSRRNGVPLWETSKVQKLRKVRNKAERTYLGNKTDLNKKHRNNASKQLKQAVNHAVKDFETKLADNIDVKPFWHYVKSKYKNKSIIGPLLKNSNNDLTENAQECAEVLSETFSSVFTKEDTNNIPFAIPKTTDELHGLQFTEELVGRHLANTKNFSSPGPDTFPYILMKAGGLTMVKLLCRLFQYFLDSGSVPSVWKIAHVSPVFKSGNRRDPLNYRPISLTSCVCKLMESCIREVMWIFWSERNLINSSQFGFIPNSSCTYQLLQYMDIITHSVDRGLLFDAAYLDFSKAFNSVPHERLLCKLSALGIKGNLLKWIRSFLTNRTEIVVVEGMHSSPKEMISGVPQGSCLGPILFIAYVNDIDAHLNNTTILKYADDIKIFRTFSKDSCNVSSSLIQNDLDALSSWAANWQLQFNINKCSVIHFGNKNPEHTFNLEGKFLQNTNNTKDLGVTVSSNLKFSTHISQIVKRAERVLAILRRTIISRDKKVFIKLYKQLVRPHLEYASVIWNPYIKRNIKLIEKVQRRATKCVKGLKDKSYSERLSILNLDSLQKRRHVCDLLFVYKIIHNISPLNMSNLFSTAAGKTKSTRGHKFKLSKKHIRLDCRKYFFSNRIVNAWNKLPDDIVSSLSVSEFKRKVSTFVKEENLLWC